ncbi:acyl-CoA thioesterase [Kordiimonas sp.]|uniref:acyl-CoA thioesterase n=1 Tax=Kordiimonas sp. TaxID=1970157 RepID=UPI003B51DA1C
MPVFSKNVQVRFAHVDAAGIMFYPRYFGLINDLVEDWFADGLGFSFRQLHLVEKRAVPTAHIEVDFHAPSKLDDKLTFTLAVERLGGASCHLKIAATCGDEARLSGNLVLVHLDMATGQSLRWPDDMRAKMANWPANNTENGTERYPDQNGESA